MKKALIQDFYKNPMSGEMIEERSFEIIDEESPGKQGFSDSEWAVVRRLIHTTGDPALGKQIKFSSDAISSGVAALKAGAPIYSDSNMIRSGVSVARLRSACSSYAPENIMCHVADADVAAGAKELGWPRSLLAVRKAAPWLSGAIVLFGNAPVGLMELNRLVLEEGVKPALVVGMPVGFVHVVESKEELCSLGVPHLVVEGRRGGSTLAVACLHALCGLVGGINGG